MNRATWLLLTFGCIAPVACFHGDLRFRSEADIKKTVAIPAGTKSLVLELDIAGIEIVPSTDQDLLVEGKARLRAEVEADLAHMAREPVIVVEGGELRIREPAQAGLEGRHQIEWQLKLFAPRGLAVSGRVGVGDVQVKERDADVTLTTGVGNVTLARVTGAATLKTGVGDAAVAEHRGAAAVVAGTGRISIDLLESKGDVKAESGVGSVHVALPRDASFTVHGSVGVGSLAGDVPLQVERSITGGTASGRIGDGQHAFGAKVGTGDLHIRWR